MANRNLRICVFYLILIASIITLLVCLFQLESNSPSLQPEYEMSDFIIEKYIKPHKSLASIPEITKSKVTIVNRKAVYNVGEKLRVHVILYDNDGKTINDGDILRIWLKEGNHSNINGEFVYHSNGGFMGTVLLPWTGQPKLYISIANTRRQISYMRNQINHFGLVYPILAKFVNKNQKVAITECSPFHNITHWRGTCNLTEQNYNVIWYSEKPSDPDIACSDWKYMNTSRGTYLSKIETDYMRNHIHVHLKTNISVTVKGEANLMYDNITKCSAINRSLTWERNSPAGYYYKGEWVIPWCKSTIKRDKVDYYKCLKHRHLLLLGDSNSRSFISYLRSFLGLTFRTGNIVAGTPWQKFAFADRPDKDLTVSWAPHETPFHSWPFYKKEILKPLFVRLDEIGRGNNSIILIHMYFHFARTSTEVFRNHVRRLRGSVDKLLQRAPDVDIFIKGPHASRYKNMVDPLDYIAPIHYQIWKEEFKGLYDKVIYLDMWDITAGSESLNAHPSAKTEADMVHTFLSFACN